MKSPALLKIIFILFCLPPSIFLSQWNSYNTGNSTYHFDCEFINEQTGWIGGAALKVFKTTNQGNNWSLIYDPGSSNRIECMDFIDSQTGYAGSYTGYVYKTTNGGYNWSSTWVKSNTRILDIFFINENTGWLTGENQLYSKTTNGGINWTNIDVSGLSNGFFVYFLNNTTGYLGGNQRLYTSTNSGSSWTLMEYADKYFHDVYFLNQNTGWIFLSKILYGSAAALHVMKTTNAGNNWQTVHSDTALYGYHTIVTDAYFITEDVGYYSGRFMYAPPPSFYYGILLKTTNSGVNWQQTGLYINYDATFIEFVNSQTGFTGGMHNSQGMIYKTTNGGPVAINNIQTEIPDKYKLYQNYPNPFNPKTKIRFEIPKMDSLPNRQAGHFRGNDKVRLTIYNSLGQIVETQFIVSQPGTYEYEFDGTKYPSGVYFYKLITGKFTGSRKMLLIK